MPKAITNAKEKILEAARKVLVEDGYKSLNIRDIANTCSIGLGTVYNYYSSKEEIVKDIMLEDWADTLGKMETCSDSGQDAIYGLRCVFLELKKFVNKYQDTWMIMYLKGSKSSKSHIAPYNKSQFYNEMKSRISLVLQRYGSEYGESDFIQDFIAKNFALYSREPNFDYKKLEDILKKILL